MYRRNKVKKAHSLAAIECEYASMCVFVCSEWTTQSTEAAMLLMISGVVRLVGTNAQNYYTRTHTHANTYVQLCVQTNN